MIWVEKKLLKELTKNETARYTLVVIFGLLVDLSLAYILAARTDIDLSFAAVIGFIAGAIFNYIFHELWTFQHGEKQLSKKRAGSYVFALVVTLLVRLVSIEFLSAMLAPKGYAFPILFAATGMSFIANYLISKFIVFRPAIRVSAAITNGDDIWNGDILMSGPEKSPPGTDWQVPEFEELVYREKGHSYALVIPVINEGERIRQQLKNVRDAELPVDILIADGGSTDGSLDHDFVRSMGVRAVLVKTGPGKLSAQLRTAYSWCLLQGYEGVVTVDGNGKDGVEAVHTFVEKLEAGYDYVQGSRYLKGGRADNTPLERTIGNRLIHAPMLSLAGRKWFTDTTNGFRGYSARYLLDTKVAPFRDIFAEYELLFYLTVRAGQLGYRACEVPVRRSYPLREPTPTKISGPGAKVELLKQTFYAAAGKYSP